MSAATPRRPAPRAQRAAPAAPSKRGTSGPLWTTRETAALRRLYPQAPRDEVLRALPRRSWTSILARACHLGVRRDVRFWSAAQDARLRAMWPDCTRRSICRALGRTWSGVLEHARDLGLRGQGERASRWAGYVSMARACEVTGYAHPQLRRILDAYREHFQALPSAERAQLPSPTPVIRAKASRFTHRVIEEQAAIDAVEWWDAQETQAMAARRMGIWHVVLSQLCARSGKRVAKHGRRPPAWWDDLVAMRDASRGAP